MHSYPLKHPITTKSGTVIDGVQLRRAKGKDMRLIDKHRDSPMALTLALIDALCLFPDGTPIFAGFADELDAEDIDALGELAFASMPDGPTTGATA
jgi:hypothetical protein